MRSFEEIPRVPITRLLGQVLSGGARRYEMREMQAGVHHELGPVVVMGRGRFTNVFLFGPDANRAVLLDHADSLSSREPTSSGRGTGSRPGRWWWCRRPVQQAPISKPVDGLPIDLEPLA